MLCIYCNRRQTFFISVVISSFRIDWLRVVALKFNENTALLDFTATIVHEYFHRDLHYLHALNLNIVLVINNSKANAQMSLIVTCV